MTNGETPSVRHKHMTGTPKRGKKKRDSRVGGPEREDGSDFK